MNIASIVRFAALNDTDGPGTRLPEAGETGGFVWSAYAMAAIFIGIAFAIAEMLTSLVARPTGLLLFLPAIAASTRIGGKGAGIFSLITSLAVIGGFYLPPVHEPGWEAAYLPQIVMWIVCAAIIFLVTRPPQPHARAALPDAGAPSAGIADAATQQANATLLQVPPVKRQDAQLSQFQAKKILIMGLPGAGKTTLAQALVPRLNAVHLNGDEFRANVDKELGFSRDDRIEHARRVGWLCDRVIATGSYVVADFICPTPETRAAFGDAFIVWVDRIHKGRYPDTNAMFEPPSHCDVRVTAEGSPAYWAEQICERLVPKFDPKAPTALFLGRFQPFHDGHKALIEEGLKRVGQVCIAVRDTHGIDEKNPLDFHAVKARIEAALWRYRGRTMVVHVPNISHVFYGRDVGYVVERLVLDESIEQISATHIRSQLIRSARA